MSEPPAKPPSRAGQLWASAAFGFIGVLLLLGGVAAMWTAEGASMSIPLIVAGAVCVAIGQIGMIAARRQRPGQDAPWDKPTKS